MATRLIYGSRSDDPENPATNLLEINDAVYQKIPTCVREEFELLANELEEANQSIKAMSVKNMGKKWVCCGPTPLDSTIKMIDHLVFSIEKQRAGSDSWMEEIKEEDRVIINTAMEKIEKMFRTARKHLSDTKIVRDDFECCGPYWQIRFRRRTREYSMYFLWVIAAFYTLCLMIMLPKLTWYVVFDL